MSLTAIAMNQAKCQNSKINQISIKPSMHVKSCPYPPGKCDLDQDVYICDFSVSSQSRNRMLTLITYHLTILGVTFHMLHFIQNRLNLLVYFKYFPVQLVHEITVGSHVFVTKQAALCWIVEISR